MSDFPLDTLHEGYPVVPASAPSARIGVYDPFERIEEEVAKGEQGEDVWQDMVSLGIRLADQDDDTHFALGRLAAAVGKKYGEDRLGMFADTIKKSKKPLQEWRQVWNFFGRDRIEEFRDCPTIRYTHFRCAMRVAQNQENAQAALDFLTEAIREEWSVGKAEVEAAQRMGKTVGPMKLGEASAEIVSIKGSTVTLKIGNEAAQQTFASYKEKGAKLLLRLYESELD